MNPAAKTMAVIMGSPHLKGNVATACQVNGFTKTFLDRLYPLTDENHVPRYGMRKLVILYTYGAPVPFLFNRYRRQASKDLKAMELKSTKMITIIGCTTQNHTEQNAKRFRS